MVDPMGPHVVKWVKWATYFFCVALAAGAAYFIYETRFIVAVAFIICFVMMMMVAILAQIVEGEVERMNKREDED